MNIDKLKKIGVSALAGSLVAFSAHAAEWSLSGGASLYADQQDEDIATTWYQGDSIKIQASGTTENGIDVAVMYELDGGANASTTGSAWDDHYLSLGTEALGTLRFWGHGGSSVMSQFDDISPKAYEEISDIGTINTVSADNVIGGIGENNMFEYTSPSFAGVTFKAAYNTASSTTTLNKYSDMGVMIQPEMVEGLTLYYASGEKQTGATEDTDVRTMAVKYAYGPVTVSYQESESDVSGSTNDDEVDQVGISYTVNDNLTVSWGTREYDNNTASNSGSGNLTQEDTGVAVSYTMGGVSISAQRNDHENVAGTDANDGESTSIGISFAF
jgi:outer membrane protein OmpU